MTVELQILFCAVALGVIQLVLLILANVATRMGWAIGPRDTPGGSLGKIGGRIERTWHNFLETFPLFAVAVLIDHALGKSTHFSALGAQLYIWARLIYVPVYVAGIPVLRTVVWGVSFAGIILVLSAAWMG